MLKTESTDFNKALVLIHKLEDQYGSLAQAPDSDPKFKEVHKLVHAEDKTADRLPRNSIDGIVSHIQDGYPRGYIESLYRLSDNEFYNILGEYHLQQKPSFKYVIYKPDGLAIYCPNQKLAAAVFGLKSSHPLPYLDKCCKRHNCRIKQFYAIWKSIPDGSGYILKDHIIHIKHGIDSFFQINA